MTAQTTAGLVTPTPRPAGPIVITAYGTPAMKGSLKHVGRGILVESSKRTKPWRDNVRQAALDVMALHDHLDMPVRVTAVFAFDRPQHHYRTGRSATVLRDNAPLWPANRGSGDIDKQVRLVLDALQDAHVFRDDAQVVCVMAEKVWAGEAHPALHIPGAHLIVEPARWRR